jgi:hypothetical protein
MFLKSLKSKIFIGSILLAMAMSACDSNTILKDNYNIADAKWFIKDTPEFEFNVDDTTTTYNVL